MGFWLLLQNCHLSLSFCEEIMQTVIDSEEIHANFRYISCVRIDMTNDLISHNGLSYLISFFISEFG